MISHIDGRNWAVANKRPVPKQYQFRPEIHPTIFPIFYVYRGFASKFDVFARLSDTKGIISIYALMWPFRRELEQWYVWIKCVRQSWKNKLDVKRKRWSRVMFNYLILHRAAAAPYTPALPIIKYSDIYIYIYLPWYLAHGCESEHFKQQRSRVIFRNFPMELASTAGCKNVLSAPFHSFTISLALARRR